MAALWQNPSHLEKILVSFETESQEWSRSCNLRRSDAKKKHNYVHEEEQVHLLCPHRLRHRLAAPVINHDRSSERQTDSHCSYACIRDYTKLYSLRLDWRIVSLTAAKTNLMFSVSVAHVK